MAERAFFLPVSHPCVRTQLVDSLLWPGKKTLIKHPTTPAAWPGFRCPELWKTSFRYAGQPVVFLLLLLKGTATAWYGRSFTIALHFLSRFSHRLSPTVQLEHVDVSRINQIMKQGIHSIWNAILCSHSFYSGNAYYYLELQHKYQHLCEDFPKFLRTESIPPLCSHHTFSNFYFSLLH